MVPGYLPVEGLQLSLSAMLLSLCSVKLYAMKTCGKSEGIAPPFFISAPCGGWVAPRIGLDSSCRRTPLPAGNRSPQSPAHSSVRCLLSYSEYSEIHTNTYHMKISQQFVEYLHAFVDRYAKRLSRSKQLCNCTCT
jgi:hypothetical protein